MDDAGTSSLGIVNQKNAEETITAAFSCGKTVEDLTFRLRRTENKAVTASLYP
jgi:hypothetical protein